MRILVTGGTGFLGSYICQDLVKEGHEVLVLARTQKNVPENTHFILGDICNLDSLIKATNACDAVFHVAAKAGIWGYYREYFYINVEGTKNVYEACKQNKIKYLIYTSSPSVVFNGKNMENVDESLKYPNYYEAHYPYTKAIAEKFILENNQKEDIKTCALRPHLIWGIGDNHLIPRFLKRAKSLRIVGNGKNLVDCTHVKNASLAHVLAFKELLKDNAKCAGKAYFIANDEPIFLFDWINRFLEGANLPKVTKKVPAFLAYSLGSIIEAVYKSFAIEKEPKMTRFLASELSTAHWFNLSNAKNDFGYKPVISNEEGFQELFKSEWFLNLLKH